MARNFLRKILPAPDRVRGHPRLQMFGKLLHDPNLWHLNRRSVTVASFIGLFCAFIPLPIQMVSAGALAIIFSVNLPIALLLVWVSNPLTMPGMFYIAYQVGALLLDVRPQPFEFELSWAWLQTELAAKWQPLLLGSLLCGLFAGLVGAAISHILWRVYVIRRWRHRREKRLKRR
jgi:uncharacterized protein